MSAIAGVVHLDGRPCDPAAVRTMAGALRYRAPGGTSTWTQGCAGLVHGLIVTTPESASETQRRADCLSRRYISLSTNQKTSLLIDLRLHRLPTHGSLRLGA